jgi:NAD(P)-dependent dehydrogenase (short-subunit alcohol dehydrogenase family)
MLQDKVVVVCGVGPGLGRAIAVQSARAGADVVLAARTERWCKEAAAQIMALGRRAVTAVTDVTDDALAATLPAVALDAFGRVDALVNNAFAIPPISELAGVDLDGVRAGLETSVLGALRMTRLFTEALAESHGSVVMINSAVLRHSRLTFGPYKMAKAALLAHWSPGCSARRRGPRTRITPGLPLSARSSSPGCRGPAPPRCTGCSPPTRRTRAWRCG